MRSANIPGVLPTPYHRQIIEPPTRPEISGDRCQRFLRLAAQYSDFLADKTDEFEGDLARLAEAELAIPAEHFQRLMLAYHDDRVRASIGNRTDSLNLFDLVKRYVE